MAEKKAILSWEQADQIIQDQRAEIAQLKDAIRRLADYDAAIINQLKEAIRRLAAQDATLSVIGDVTVTMDATLTAEERADLEFVTRIT